MMSGGARPHASLLLGTASSLFRPRWKTALVLQRGFSCAALLLIAFSMKLFDLQGHRGARGLKPENTLPGFEVALDVGVSSVETDLHLTRDDVPVLFHDAVLGPQICTPLAGSRRPELECRPVLRSLTLEQLRNYRADQNPDPVRFPEQDASPTPAVLLFARQRGLDAYAIPTLADLFSFVEAYAGDLGRQAGKTEQQRRRASYLCFDLEIKRVPFHPEMLDDPFTDDRPGLLEKVVVEEAHKAGVMNRLRVRSFDHRSVRTLRSLEPRLITAVLIADTAPVEPAQLALQAGAWWYCPGVDFLDLAQVKQCQAEGVRVIPWTVNDPSDWRRLLDWQVDGITTDYPDRLGLLLQERGIRY
jgi:glycerophosphoryl diester phosphodiesterase